MNHTVFKQRYKLANLPILSILLGLMTVSGCNSTNTPSASSLSATQDKSGTDRSVGQSQITNSSSLSATQDKSGTDRWVGQWHITEPSSGQILKFMFTPEGKLFYLSPETSSSPIAYEIRVQKISDATTLPPNTQIVGIQETFNNQATRAKQSEGKTYIGAMNRAQQAYYLENNKFGTTIAQLGIGIKPETESFNYQILPQGNGTQNVMNTAKAKLPKLHSYTGAVFVIENNGENITRAAICETDKPSSTPPAMPTPPKNASEQIQCPAGSHSLEK